MIGGGFILKPLPPRVLCGQWTALGSKKIELTSRLRGHVCLLACCCSSLPPPPTSPPWWLLLILLLLLLVHVCVPTSLGVFDDPGDAAPAFPSPQLHNSLLAPCNSLLATAVILLIFQPCLDRKKFSIPNQSQQTSDKTCCRPAPRIFSFTLGCCSALALPPSFLQRAGRNHLQTLLLPTCRKYC